VEEVRDAQGKLLVTRLAAGVQVAVIAIPKGHALAVEPDEAVVFDRAAAYVLGQIRHHAAAVGVPLGDAEVPLPARGRLQDGAQAVGGEVGEQRQAPGPREGVEGPQHLPTEELPHHGHWEKKPRADRPPLAGGIQSPATHQTVDMGMEGQCAAPRVQRGQHARLRPEPARICQQGQVGLAHRAEHQRGHGRAVPAPEVVQLARSAEL
jgi:hypothetical protein